MVPPTRMVSRSLMLLLGLGLIALPVLGQQAPRQILGSDGKTMVSVTNSPARNAAPDLRVGHAPQWGIQDGNDYWVPGAAFNPRDAAETHDGDGGSNGYFWTTSNAFNIWWAPLNLPNGVLLDGIRVYYYDNSGSDIDVYLTQYIGDGAGGLSDVYAFTSTGTPGYTTDFIGTPITIDLRDDTTGEAQFYVINVRFNDTSGNIRLKGARAFYHLQVSPAPLSQTFTDVPPSDPAFQYIEAFGRAAITAGCQAPGDPPAYCPDATLTRRQMAVFFAKALGLHWPL
jgi:hypothetical protein